MRCTSLFHSNSSQMVRSAQLVVAAWDTGTSDDDLIPVNGAHAIVIGSSVFHGLPRAHSARFLAPTVCHVNCT